MINYFDAAENTLRSRSMLEKALKNLMRRQERIMRHNAPSGYPSLDTSKPYTSTKSVNDALTDCIEIAEVAREINRTKDKIDEIDSVLQQLDPQDAELLRLWYIERKKQGRNCRTGELCVAPRRSTICAIKPLRALLCCTSARMLGRCSDHAGRF